MTDYPTPSNFLSPMPAYPVKQVSANNGRNQKEIRDEPIVKTTSNCNFMKLKINLNKTEEMMNHDESCWLLRQMCKAIDDPALGNDTFAKLYGAANVYYNYTGTAACFDLADDSDPHGLGEWTWQVRNILPLFLHFLATWGFCCTTIHK